MVRKLISVLVMLGFVGAMGSLAGCNTMAGAGKDIERGGEKVEREAREAQRKM